MSIHPSTIYLCTFTCLLSSVQNYYTIIFIYTHAYGGWLIILYLVHFAHSLHICLYALTHNIYVFVLFTIIYVVYTYIGYCRTNVKTVHADQTSCTKSSIYIVASIFHLKSEIVLPKVYHILLRYC